eukprot:RCo048152
MSLAAEGAFRSPRDHSARGFGEQQDILAELQVALRIQKENFQKTEADILQVTSQISGLDASALLNQPLASALTTPSPHLSALEREEVALREAVSSLQLDREALLRNREAELDARRAYLSGVSQVVKLLEWKIREASVLEERMMECGHPTTNAAVEGLQGLADIEAERENLLRTLQEEHALLTARLKAKDEELAVMMRKENAWRPDLAAEDPRLVRIRAEWAMDRAALVAEYEKLLALNREQKFHLTRGTSKRVKESEEVWAAQECRDLKLQKTILLREIDAVRLQQQDLLGRQRELLSAEATEAAIYAEAKAQALHEIEGLMAQRQILAHDRSASATPEPYTPPKPTHNVSSGSLSRK